MLWDAPSRKPFLLANFPISTKIFQPQDSHSASLPETSLILLLRGSWTSWEDLDPDSHLPCHLTVFFLCFKFVSFKTHPASISTCQFQLRCSCLPICNLLLYLLLAPRSLTCPDYLVPTPRYSALNPATLASHWLCSFLLVSTHVRSCPVTVVVAADTHTPDFIHYLCLSSSSPTLFWLWLFKNIFE